MSPRANAQLFARCAVAAPIDSCALTQSQQPTFTFCRVCAASVAMGRQKHRQFLNAIALQLSIRFYEADDQKHNRQLL